MLNKNQADELIVTFGHALCNKKTKVELFRCSHCKRVIAVPEESINALIELKTIDSFPNTLYCPFCSNHTLQLIKKTEQNEEHWEAYEQDLNTFEAKPVIHVCHQCAFMYLSFKKDVDQTTSCPLCNSIFDSVNSTHASLTEPITDKLLKKAQELNNHFNNIETDINNDYEIPLESLGDLLCEIKLFTEKKPFLGFIIGHNSKLGMTIIAKSDKKNSNQPCYIWIKDNLFEYIKEIGLAD